MFHVFPDRTADCSAEIVCYLDFVFKTYFPISLNPQHFHQTATEMKYLLPLVHQGHTFSIT